MATVDVRKDVGGLSSGFGGGIVFFVSVFDGDATQTEMLVQCPKNTFEKFLLEEEFIV